MTYERFLWEVRFREGARRVALRVEDYVTLWAKSKDTDTVEKRLSALGCDTLHTLPYPNVDREDLPRYTNKATVLAAAIRYVLACPSV